MSSPLAIAGVTYVLRDLLNNGMVDNDLSNNVKVTALPPLRDPNPSTGDVSQLNVFLYQITPNQGWRNQGLPAFDNGGTRTSNPPLAIDLHYLVTAYDERDFHAEVLLGYAMQLLHENPVLPRKAIRGSLLVNANLPARPGGELPGLPPTLPEGLRKLSGSGLADQIETIKISPQYLTTEEMSKLWTSFMAPYRPSMAYLVTVVLIESDKPTKPALPVRERNVYAVPFRQPHINSVEAASGPRDFILSGATLLVKGDRLRSQPTRLLMDGKPITVSDADVRDSEISCPVPDSLYAGIHSLHVAHEFNLGTPPTAHRGVESNVAAFLLHPTIAVPPPVDKKVAIGFNPKVGKSQRVRVMLNEDSAPVDRAAHAYSLEAPKDNGITATNQPDTGEIAFSLEGIAAGTYFVRAFVDGAESPLAVETDRNHPAYNTYTGPKIIVPA